MPSIVMTARSRGPVRPKPSSSVGARKGVPPAATVVDARSPQHEEAPEVAAGPESDLSFLSEALEAEAAGFDNTFEDGHQNAAPPAAVGSGHGVPAADTAPEGELAMLANFDQMFSPTEMTGPMSADSVPFDASASDPGFDGEHIATAQIEPETKAQMGLDDLAYAKSPPAEAIPDLTISKELSVSVAALVQRLESRAPGVRISPGKARNIPAGNTELGSLSTPSSAPAPIPPANTNQVVASQIIEMRIDEDSVPTQQVAVADPRAAQPEVVDSLEETPALPGLVDPDAKLDLDGPTHLALGEALAQGRGEGEGLNARGVVVRAFKMDTDARSANAKQMVGARVDTKVRERLDASRAQMKAMSIPEGGDSMSAPDEDTSPPVERTALADEKDLARKLEAAADHMEAQASQIDPDITADQTGERRRPIPQPAETKTGLAPIPSANTSVSSEQPSPGESLEVPRPARSKGPVIIAAVLVVVLILGVLLFLKR